MRDPKGLFPPLYDAFKMLRDKAADKKLNIILTDTMRTAAEQAAYYAQSRSPLAEVNRLRKLANLAAIDDRTNRLKITNARTAVDSYHWYGLAFDIAVTDSTGKKIEWSVSKLDWNGNKKSDWLEVAELAASCGLEAGYFWKKLPDPPHFQMSFGLSIADLKSGKYPAYWQAWRSSLPF